MDADRQALAAALRAAAENADPYTRAIRDASLGGVLGTLGRGVAANLAGLPVDLANAIIGMRGNPANLEGGTDWMAQNVFGMDDSPLSSAALILGSILGPGPKWTGSRSNIAKILTAAKREGGGTVPLSGAARPQRGYAVATTKAGKQTVFDPADVRPKDIENFMREQRMSKDDALGLWMNPDDGKLYLDKSNVYPSRFRALNEGNANQQIAIWDLARKKNIDTPDESLRRLREVLQSPEESPPAYSVLRPRKTVPGEATLPGLWDNPKRIVNDSAKMVAPEDPLLRELFGVDRADLDALAYQNQDFRIANPLVYEPTRVPEHVGKVTTPSNARRLQDVIGEAADDQRFTGMPGWYVTNPLLDRAKRLLGPEEGERWFLAHHKFASPMSAMNDVQSEIAKGTFTHLLAGQNNLDEFFDVGRLPAGLNHPAHTTAHAAGVRNMMESGGERFWSAANPSPKTPNYYMSKTGQNWYWPTGDAHFVRATGLPDVRPRVIERETGTRIPDASSIGKTEAFPVGKWFTNDVAAPLGLTGNVGHPVLWGAMASRTGVESAIGAPYLEILASNTRRSATRQGISPQDALDNYILISAGRRPGDPRRAYLGALTALGVGVGAATDDSVDTDGGAESREQ